jgi:hypothetical protein
MLFVLIDGRFDPAISTAFRRRALTQQPQSPTTKA